MDECRLTIDLQLNEESRREHNSTQHLCLPWKTVNLCRAKSPKIPVFLAGMMTVTKIAEWCYKVFAPLGGDVRQRDSVMSAKAVP